MSKATVCQVLHVLRVGGAEVLAARLVRRLVGEYHFVFVCLDELGAFGEELRDEGFAVEVLGRRPGLDWSCSRRLAEVVRRHRVDLLHAHQYTPFFYGAMARLRSPGPPILFTEHGRFFPDYPRRKRMVVNRLLLRKRDRVVGVGGTVRQALIRNEGIPSRRVGVVYNGIDLNPYRTDASDRSVVRREVGVADDDLVLITVARLDPLKDLATALGTIERVARIRGGAKLLLVGEGPEEGMVRAVIRERGLEENVRLLGLRGDVPRLLRAADIFLLTSVSEGIPLVVIEAMAAGLPVVATRVGGLPEVVDEEETGLLAASGDDDGLARCVIRISGEPEVAAAMGEAGRVRAEALFSEDRMVAAYDAMYREMLRG